MSESVADLLEQVQAEAGFDVTQAQALRAMNQRYRLAVVRAKVLRAEMSLGNTVASQAAYALDAKVAEVESLTVAGVPWRRVGGRTLNELQGAYSQLVGSGGVYAQWPTTAGVEKLNLFPVPATAGDALSILAVQRPDDLLAGDTASSIVIPPEYNEPILVDGTIAALLARIDERLDDADRYDGRYQAATEELRRAALGRFRSGPGQVKVVGYHI